MKQYIAVAALLLSASAFSQSTPGAPQAQPPCWPKPFGSGTTFKTNTAVIDAAPWTWTWWYCSDKYKYDPYVVAGSTDFFSTTKTYEAVVAVNAAADKQKALADLWKANVTVPWSSMPATLKTAVRKDTHGNHFVAQNGSLPTRPSFPIVDGKRGSTSNGASTVGAACDCVKTYIISTYAYCAAPSTSTAPSITVCEPKLK